VPIHSIILGAPRPALPDARSAAGASKPDGSPSPRPVPSPTPAPAPPQVALASQAAADTAATTPLDLDTVVDELGLGASIGDTLTGGAAAMWTRIAETLRPAPHFEVSPAGALNRLPDASILYESTLAEAGRYAAASRVLGAVGLAADAYRIATADDKTEAAIEAAGGFAGAWAGAESGAAIGAAACLMGGVSAPAAPVCGLVGGIAGSVAGGFGGRTAAREFYPPLEAWGTTAADWPETRQPP